jgi:hypothetical protein
MRGHAHEAAMVAAGIESPNIEVPMVRRKDKQIRLE